MSTYNVKKVSGFVIRQNCARLHLEYLSTPVLYYHYLVEDDSISVEANLRLQLVKGWNDFLSLVYH